MSKVYETGKIYKICKYPPYRGGSNPEINADTYRIMDLKNPSVFNHKKAVVYYGNKLNDGFGRISSFLKTKELQVAIVPSSKEGKISEGLEGALSCVDKVNIVYDRDFLVRGHDVPTAHEGGDRSIEKHLNSVSVVKRPDPDIPLILLDDVTTSGNSLHACREILEKAGVKEVYMVAIGHTV
ncbi:TPA: hypothetical protein ACX3GO_003965 [Vibrio parahaemolyticus]